MDSTTRLIRDGEIQVQGPKERVIQKIDLLAPQLIELATTIHDHPETRFREYHAVEALSAALARFGYPPETGIGELKTAFRSTHSFGRAGKNVAFFAEFDALPEIGHACGHNLIAAAAIGAFLAFHDLKDGLGGSVTIFGTPGEEGGGGKVRLLSANAFRGVDAALMFHPASFTAISPHSLALIEVQITFTGRAAHAGSPECGVNALEAVLQTFNSINSLRGYLRPDARINGIIYKGGHSQSVIPEAAEAVFTVRAIDEDYTEVLADKVRRAAEGAAIALGAELSTRRIGQRKAMLNNESLARAFEHNLRCAGGPTAGGKPEPFSTDMGDVSRVIPAIHPMLAIADDVPLHSRDFAAASASDRGFEVMIAASKALAMTAVDVLLEHDEVKGVATESQKPEQR